VVVTGAKNTAVRKLDISHICGLFELSAKIKTVVIDEREAISCLF
jgi:hypothetical protein